MKKILLHCSRRYINVLLNNSHFIKEDNLYNLNSSQLAGILSHYNIDIFENNNHISDNYDIIIIDELDYYDEYNKKCLYYFIPPIDFNIADPFISNRWPNCLYDSTHPNKVAWANTNFPNLYFLGSNIFESSNHIFDLSLVLNLNNHNDNWGIYHYEARNLFKSVYRKNFRLDYCFREVKKENRVKFLLELLDFLSESELKNIKISAHGDFLINQDYYEETKSFFERENHLSLFLELEKVDRKFFSFDKLLNSIPGFNSWPINKLFLNTFSSDISCYFETARDTKRAGNVQSTMMYLITEKTIDLLNVGKPFIHLSNNVDVFLNKFGFINYNTEVFDSIASDKRELVKKILNMESSQYERMLNQLKNMSIENCKILDSYYKNNTFLFNLLHN